MSFLALAFIASSCLVQIVNSGPVSDKYSCPHGWTRYGTRKCLKYVNELQDYERAQATCRAKNQGTLVTVHSHDEQNFVYSYIHSIAASSTPIWLGAKQIDFESILWLDKTENAYTNWAPSEPSHPDEICIAINPRNGMWRDVMCTEANVPACERAPTTQWPFFVPFCSEGWFQFNDEKCVRILSSQALNFYESQELCRSKYNSKLLSIKSDKESEFLHNLIKFRDVKLPVWLGAVQNDFSSFNWIDKSDVTFTNWQEGEPNDPDHACLSMTASSGKWSDNDCKEQKLILCQKVVPEDSSCETGWLQFRQDKCYRFVHIKLAFDDAESLCNNLYGGHLPSIHSQEEQFMIAQFLASVNVKNGSEIWLGGRQMDFHNFNWADGSLFNYSYWDNGEPNFPAEKCIEMSWRNGRWNDINCRLKRAVLCERQVSSRHQLSKPNLYQPTTCLETNCSAVAGTLASTGGQSILTSQPEVTSAPQHSDDSPTDPLAVSAVLMNTNSSTAPLDSSTDALNGTMGHLSTNHSSSSPIDAIFLEDKPIKVIASIMNRPEQAAASGADPLASLHNSSVGDLVAATINATSSQSQTFVHYNLPPPGSPAMAAVAPADRASSADTDSIQDAMYTSGESSSLVGKKALLEDHQPSSTPLIDLLQRQTSTQQPGAAATSKLTIENPQAPQSADILSTTKLQPAVTVAAPAAPATATTVTAGISSVATTSAPAQSGPLQSTVVSHN